MSTFDDLFTSLKNATKGTLKTSLGNNQSIYKDEIFAGQTDDEKKRNRSKIRKYIENIFSTITDTNCTNANKEINVKAFLDFYFATYRVNDFSLSSICNDNMKQEKKDLFAKGLEVVKAYYNKSNKKSK